MLKRWKSLSYTTRFSIIACIINVLLGLFSMGFLGLALYYPVSFLFISYPHLDDLHGDWVWPALIGVGMFWSFGFVLGGIAWHYLRKWITSTAILRILYIIILWLWAALLWYIVITENAGLN